MPAKGTQVLCNQKENLQRPVVKSLIYLHFWLYFITETSEESQPFTLPLKYLMTNKKILTKEVSEFNYWFLFLFLLVTR